MYSASLSISVLCLNPSWPLYLYFSEHLNVLCPGPCASSSTLVDLFSDPLPCTHLIRLLRIMHAHASVSSGNNILLVGEGGTFSNWSHWRVFVANRCRTILGLLCVSAKMNWSQHQHRCLNRTYMSYITEGTLGSIMGGSKTHQLRAWAVALGSCAIESQVCHLLLHDLTS